MAPGPSKVEQEVALQTTAKAAARKAAAPSFSDLAEEFGSDGLRYDANGKVNGYKYPEPKTEADRVSLNERVHEMWNPQRKLAVEHGGEYSARQSKKMVRLRTRKGEREVPEEKVEKVDRAIGVRGSRFGYSHRYSEAEFWRNKERRQG